MRDRIRRIFKTKDKPLKRLNQWAREPAKRVRRAKRYRALAKFAESRRARTKQKARREKWADRRRAWNRKASAIEKSVAADVGDLRIIPRSEWGARPPRYSAPLTSRTNGLFVHHTVAAAPSTEEGEKAEMRSLQNFHMDSRRWNDIAYSFVVFPSGRIYEGRGLDVQGAHTEGYNSTSHAGSAAGNYDANQPSNNIVHSLHWLNNYLGGGTVRGHRDVGQTACPGRYLYARIDEID